MMQDAALNTDNPQTTATADQAGNPVTLALSVELIAYALLLIFVLFMYVADLDIIPLTNAEATRALGAWHVVHPDAPGAAQTPDSPVIFWWQAAAFSTLGGNEFAARLGGLVGGIVLILMPLLFRSRIGTGRTFILSLLLAMSPFVLVSAREASPLLWTLIFALGALWAIWRYWDNRLLSDGLWAAGFVAALIFLSDPGGPLLALILLGALALATWWTALNAGDELDITGEDLMRRVQATLASFNPSYGLGLGVLLVGLVATGFLLYPNGLNHVSTLLGNTFSGIVQPAHPNAPLAWPVLALFVYNPLLLAFALVGALLLRIRHRVDFLARFAGAWFMLALLVLTFYRAATPDYALWLLLPLMWLAASAIAELFIDRPVLLYWFDNLNAVELAQTANRFWWVKWAVGVGVFGLLLTLSLHWSELGRGLLLMPQGEPLLGVMQRLSEPALARALRGAIWLLFTPVVMLIVYLFAASVWGNLNVLQGFGLGFFFFMLGSGLGGGWNAAVEQASNPAAFWRAEAVQPDAYLLRETLQEISQRDTQGFPLIPVTVLLPENRTTNTIVRDDGLLAWLLRDYQNTRFVRTVDGAQRDQIVLLPTGTIEATQPELAGSYIGQSFQLTRRWSTGQLAGGDFVAWFAQRRLRTDAEIRSQGVILWLRLDVYNGTPIDQRPTG